MEVLATQNYIKFPKEGEDRVYSNLGKPIYYDVYRGTSNEKIVFINTYDIKGNVKKMKLSKVPITVKNDKSFEIEIESKHFGSSLGEIEFIDHNGKILSIIKRQQ